MLIEDGSDIIQTDRRVGGYGGSNNLKFNTYGKGFKGDKGDLGEQGLPANKGPSGHVYCINLADYPEIKTTNGECTFIIDDPRKSIFIITMDSKLTDPRIDTFLTIKNTIFGINGCNIIRNKNQICLIGTFSTLTFVANVNNIIGGVVHIYQIVLKI